MRPIYMHWADAHVSFVVWGVRVCVSVRASVCGSATHALANKEQKNCPFVAYKNNGPKNLKSISNVLAKAN